MFTGIIEEVGTVIAAEKRHGGARLTIGCHSVLLDAGEGASVAVNGVCLTAVDLTPSSFSADLAPETVARSSLGDLRVDSLVNLERPLKVNGRFDGHIVQGHVDGTGKLLSLEQLGDENWWLRLSVPENLDRYIVEKGSLAIDGISLTVASIANGTAAVTIIPHTYRHTSLAEKKPGDRLNLECDMVAKYIEKLLAACA